MTRSAFALRRQKYAAVRAAELFASPGADPVRAVVARLRPPRGADHLRFAVTPSIRARP
jgi:hypothetical protein